MDDEVGLDVRSQCSQVGVGGESGMVFDPGGEFLGLDHVELSGFESARDFFDNACCKCGMFSLHGGAGMAENGNAFALFEQRFANQSLDGAASGARIAVRRT